MSNNNIALSFDTAEYYNLQEASDYLNRKLNIDNITPMKLVKHIYSRGINTFIHFRIDNLDKCRLRMDFYESNFFPKFDDPSGLDKDEIEYLLKITKKVKDSISSSIIDDLYMGMFLFKIDKSTLFNMSFKNNPNDRVEAFLFDGFIHRYSMEDNPNNPSQLAKWSVNIDDKKYCIEDITSMVFVIDSVNTDVLNDFANKSPFPCSFEKREDYAFAHNLINPLDLIILHKDLKVLENHIIKNLPTVEKSQNPFKKRGVSPKLLMAKLVANTHAQHLLSKDYDKSIRIREICDSVWNYLVDTEYREVLPDKRESLKGWLNDIPEYASKAGAPKK